ncbi:MAG: TIGR03067 domain-containing protein [Gemmataceae bacterium]|nr:TIGR03067 domain-containing protein [Gemmataceae bacterium]
MCRSVLLILVSFATLGVQALGQDPAKQDSTKGDLQKFQGIWQLVSVRNPDGQPASDEDLKAARLVVKGNEFTFTTKDASISGTFTIDPSKTPKTIDFVLKGGKPEEKFQGIYDIRGDRRLSCFALPKQDRPRELRPTQKGYLMFEWKPAAQ